MYRITENKRIQRSANLIKDALLTCLEEKSFKEVTVSDIQRISGVSRATFYRIFDNTSDVLTYHCDLLMQTVDERFTEFFTAEESDFIIGILRFWQKNYTLLETLFATGREDILQNAMFHRTIKFYKHFQIKELSSNDVDYLVAGTIGFLVGILMTWVKHGKQESAEELYEIFSHLRTAIPSPLQAQNIVN